MQLAHAFPKMSYTYLVIYMTCTKHTVVLVTSSILLLCSGPGDTLPHTET